MRVKTYQRDETLCWVYLNDTEAEETSKRQHFGKAGFRSQIVLDYKIANMRPFWTIKIYQL